MEPIECPVAASARRRPSAPALVHAKGSLDYAALDGEVRRMQAVLAEHGVRAGARLALLTGNDPLTVPLVHAAARLRAPVVLLNARLTAKDLGAQLAASRPSLAIASAGLRERLSGEAFLLEGLAVEAARVSPAGGPATIAPDAAHTFLFTSGTEGRPKAAVLSARAHLASARAANEVLALDGSSRFLCPLPLFHVGGLSILVRCALASAALWLQERFDAGGAARALARGATHASLVAATLFRTLEAHGEAPFPSTVRAVLVGGGPTPAALLERARRAALPVLQTYGLTEAASQVCTERPGEADGLTSGPALPGTRLRIVTEEGSPVPPGVAGEIEVGGPTLFCGYLDDPEATARAQREGFLRTRDLGFLDGRGRLVVLARRTDVIVSGGENVYPAEVEAALLDHEGIVEAAALGRADPVWGQVVVAAVVRRSPELGEREVQAHCRARLASFKVPREVRFLAELPRTAAGKIDRRALPAALDLPTG